MASKCIGDCVNIKSDAVCVRPGTTYAKTHKWPAAEAEFVRSISHGGSLRRTTAVDSISCRQMYLRSYTFSRKEESEDCSNRGGGDASEQKNERGGRKKAGKKSRKTSKTTATLRGFVVRFVWKCLSPIKVDVEQ